MLDTCLSILFSFAIILLSKGVLNAPLYLHSSGRVAVSVVCFSLQCRMMSICDYMPYNPAHVFLVAI